MKTLKQWQFIKNEKNRIDLACDHGFILHIFVLEMTLFVWPLHEIVNLNFLILGL